MPCSHERPASPHGLRCTSRTTARCRRFDFFALEQLLTGGLCLRVPAPGLEMDEHLVVGLAANIRLGNQVNAVHCTQVQLLNHLIDVLASCALEHARDANAGFAGFGVGLGLGLSLFLFDLFLFFVLENVRRIGENLGRIV